MENASKALIMAASVLLGVMIISVGVALYNTFSSFSADTAKKMQEKQLSEWNNVYLKYQGSTEVTAHDIISVINSAAQNNKNYFEDEANKTQYAGKENYYYVQVSITGMNGITGLNNAENWDEETKMKFLKENSLTDENGTKYFNCTNVEISSVTKRVYKITFKA